MEEIDLVSKDTVADLIKQKFESPLPKCQDDDDPFVKVTRMMIMSTLLYLYPGWVWRDQRAFGDESDDGRGKAEDWSGECDADNDGDADNETVVEKCLTWMVNAICEA